MEYNNRIILKCDYIPKKTLLIGCSKLSLITITNIIY